MSDTAARARAILTRLDKCGWINRAELVTLIDDLESRQGDQYRPDATGPGPARLDSGSTPHPLACPDSPSSCARYHCQRAATCRTEEIAAQ